MNNKVTLTGANLVFFSFVVLFLIFQLLLTIPMIIYGEDFINHNIFGVLLINQYIIILIPVAIYSIFKKVNVKETFRLNNPGVLPMLLVALISLPAFFAMGMLNSLVLYFLQFIGDFPSQPIPVPQNLKELTVGILIVAVSPAICEELLNRGIMLKGYEKRGSMKAVVITALFFGIFHFDITNLVGPIFIGLLMGYYVIRTNSIFPGMLAHFSNNAINEIFQYIARNEPATGDVIKITEADLFGSCIYGFTGLILIWLLLLAFKKATEGKSCMLPPISSIQNDVVSILTHWPVIIILVLYTMLAGLTLLSSFLAKLGGV